MSELRDAGILVRMVHQGFINAGIDASAIYARCGITRHHLEDHHIRTPHRAQSVFWQAAEEITGDKCIGLHLGEHMPLFGGQVIEYLFLSSANFSEGLNRFLRYQRLLSDAVMVYTTVHNDNCLLVLEGSDHKNVLTHFIDAVLLGALRFFKYVTQNVFQPTCVYLAHAGDEFCDEYHRIFDCPVVFQSCQNAIEFPCKVMDNPSRHAEPELMKAHEMIASEQIERLKKRDVIIEIERVVGELLESGEVSLATVASRLGMTTRALRSRLAEADTCFNQVLACFRSNLAKKLLARTDESIDEIVYLTGFSEPSTFYRAFKRWTGQTPIEYRKKKQWRSVHN